MTIQLIPAGEPSSSSRQSYEPVVARVNRLSKWPGSFGFDDLNIFGPNTFWKYDGMPQLAVGSSYVLSLATKAKQGGGSYTDIDGAEPLTAENCPEGFEVHTAPDGTLYATVLGAPATAAPVAEHPQAPESAPSGQPAPVPADSATHAEYTGAPWSTELPSFHTWKERGIQKMSARNLKATVGGVWSLLHISSPGFTKSCVASVNPAACPAPIFVRRGVLKPSIEAIFDCLPDG